MLRVENLSCNRSGRKIFSSIFFNLNQGEIISFLGPNGSGKTSLILCLTGSLPINDGHIYWNESLVTYDLDDHSEYIDSFELFYHHNDLDDSPIPVNKHLGLATETGGFPYSVGELTHLFSLNHLMDIPTESLSFGQKKKLLFLKLILKNRIVWLLDEPFIGLDTSTIRIMQSLIFNHLDDGGIVILSTHQSVFDRYRSNHFSVWF